MKNGWYKIEYGKSDYFMNSDYWPPSDEIAYVENDVITETMNEYGKFRRPTKVAITEELKKCMIIMELEGMGLA